MQYLPDIKTIYNRLKASAKKRNIPFSLTVAQLYELSFPITCPILNIPLRFNRGKLEDNSYSIDRVDNSLGYEIDNIIVISYKANRLKNNASNQELKQLSEFYCNNFNIKEKNNENT
ncbi:MAG: hypothetical protein WC679_01035 [Bacteroidales bacterium]|jgi:hypothetical protein